MPGIFDPNGEEKQNNGEVNSEECVADESSAAAAAANENAVPPAEVNQTDKINKFLLKSFLERMNNEMLPVNVDGEESMENADGREWK